MTDYQFEEPCQDCGTKVCVMKTNCPYSLDVNDTVIEIFVCEDCYHQRLAEI